MKKIGTNLSPILSDRLYKTLLRSVLLYAMEICDWDVVQVKDLEKLQAKSLRSLYDLYRQFPKAIVLLLTRVEPLEVRMDLYVLLFYAKICNSTLNTFMGKHQLHRTYSLNNPPIGSYSDAFFPNITSVDFEKTFPSWTLINSKPS